MGVSIYETEQSEEWHEIFKKPNVNRKLYRRFIFKTQFDRNFFHGRLVINSIR